MPPKLTCGFSGPRSLLAFARVAKPASGHGAAGAGSPHGLGRGGRNLPGGLEESLAGRQHGDKVLIVVAAQANGSGIGRVRMRVIPDASAASLHPFVRDSIVPGSTVHTDGWQGYKGLNKLATTTK